MIAPSPFVELTGVYIGSVLVSSENEDVRESVRSFFTIIPGQYSVRVHEEGGSRRLYQFMNQLGVISNNVIRRKHKQI
jgi:hypothetical protein